MAASGSADFRSNEYMSTVGASSSSALSYLQSLLQQGSTKDAKKASATDPLSMLMQATSGDDDDSSAASTTAASPTAGAGSTCPSFSAGSMSAMISAQGDQSTADAKLFAKLDTDGDGKISKDEFTAATSKAGIDSSLSDAVYAKLDGDSDGSVTQAELTKADQASGGGHHHHVHGGGGGPPPAADGQDPIDAMLSDAAASGATTQSSSNADGSTTTTISYADGSKVSLTSAAAASSTSTADASSSETSTTSASQSKFNLLEQLIKMQSQMLTAATSTLSAIA
jgi:hypothetical protein